MLPHCLVLNSTYSYLDVCSWFDAFCLLHEEKATPIAEYDDTIRSQYLVTKLPAVMVMKSYVNIHRRRNALNTVTKKNILIRDGFACQYCGAKLTMSNGTIDHVHPKSKGGKHTLENTVAACKPCNNFKGDMSLSAFTEKTGYHLKTIPRPLTEEEKIMCLFKTVRSKERTTWIACLKDNNISLW